MSTDIPMRAVIRNYYLQQRSIQITIGDVEIKVPKIRDHSDNWSMLQYLVATELSEACKKQRRIAILAGICEGGISAGDFHKALSGRFLLKKHMRDLSLPIPSAE
ncbi:MAG: hypothetical protein ACTS73_01740 [Arsenophonus sp. NEOnobi-MAG3]